jgi:hypothetical protein
LGKIEEFRMLLINRYFHRPEAHIGHVHRQNHKMCLWGILVADFIEDYLLVVVVPSTVKSGVPLEQTIFDKRKVLGEEK